MKWMFWKRKPKSTPGDIMAGVIGTLRGHRAQLTALCDARQMDDHERVFWRSQLRFTTDMLAAAEFNYGVWLRLSQMPPADICDEFPTGKTPIYLPTGEIVYR